MGILKILADQKNYIIYNKVIANKYGIFESIILGDLISKENYFEQQNKLDSEGFFYSTYEDIENSTSIKRDRIIKAIQTLVDFGMISKKGAGIPRKTYYKINEERTITCLSFEIQTTRDSKFKQQNEGNPNLLSNNNKYNKIIDNNIKEDNEADASSLPLNNFTTNSKNKKKSILPKEKIDFIKEISAIVEINAIFPKEEGDYASGSLVTISNIIDDFYDNGLLRYKFKPDWVEKAYIDWSVIKNASMVERKAMIMRAAKIYTRLKIYGNWPHNKNILAKSLLGFFYNSFTQKSWMLFCMFNKTEEANESISNINYEKTVPKEVQEHVQEIMDYYKWDVSTFKRNVTSLYIWWRDYKDDLHLVNGGGFYSWGSNFNDLFDRMIEFFETWNGGVGLHNITHGSKSWDCFCKRIEEKYKVKLNPTAAEIEYARKQKEKWNEEDKRKSRYAELKEKKNVSDELAGYIEGGKVNE
jgi:hypothetical protein